MCCICFHVLLTHNVVAFLFVLLQDMACDTFLKISNKCKRKFVVLQLQEQQPFVGELLDNLTDTIQDLQPHQIQSFYESVGLMISAEGERRELGGTLAGWWRWWWWWGGGVRLKGMKGQPFAGQSSFGEGGRGW